MKFHLLMSSAMLFAMAGSAMAAKVTVTGNVTDVFGHRYVVDEGGKKSLVDIGPKGRDAVTINSGDKVSVEGELTDAGEVRAASVAVGDKPAVELPEARTWWEKLTGAEPKDKVDLTPDAAKVMVQKAGYEVIGEPRPEEEAFRSARQEGRQILRSTRPRRRRSEGHPHRRRLGPEMGAAG
jgi:hypothetical protein